jgi:hypothetical protein
MRSTIELIRLSLKDYKQEAATLIGYSTWILLPFAAFVLLSLLPMSPVVQLLAFFLMVAELFFVIWVTITIALHAHAHIHGHPKNTDALSAKARALMAPMLTVILLQLLILIGGLLLLVVPMFIFAIWFGMSQFMVIFEGKRGLDALSASHELVRGRFWSSVAFIVGGPLIIMIIYSVILSLIISLISATQGVDTVELLLGELPLWVNVLEAVGEVFLLPLLMVYFTYVYLELKNARATTLDKERNIA